MAAEPLEIVARGSECAETDALLARTVAVLLTGDAGIGKTAIWESVVAGRRAAGDHLLVSRASVAEATLPWVGMTDLLRGVPASVLEALPEPQRQALRAVSLEGGGLAEIDERAVGTALLSVLQRLTETAPVLVAVDDLPYLDAASGAAVAFALRRHDGELPARVLATVRGHDLDLPLLRGLPAERVTSTAIGPLTLGALFELLRTRRGIRLARPLLLRVYETSGGNPLYALELARALDRLAIAPTATGPLPVPAGLDALVDARVRSLDPDVAEVVAATAASWRFDGSGVDPAAIDRAAAAGMVVVDESAARSGQRVVRAAHPLLSAAAYESLSAARRRALHERLASAADDPVERVRHAAMAATEPRADLAVDLDEAAIAALAAGVPDIATGLAQLALDHTVDPAFRPARLDRLADARFRAGDSAGAWQAQDQAMAASPPGPERARRRIRLAEITTEVHGWRDAERELHLAVEEAAADPLVLAEALLTLAAVTPDIELGDTSSRRALHLLESMTEPDPVILAGALTQVATAHFNAGRGLDHERFAQAIEIERQHPFRRLSDRADAGYAALLKYADDLDGAEQRLLLLLEEAYAIGDLTSIAYAAGHLVQTQLWRGRLGEGRTYADQHVDVAIHGEMTGQGTAARYNLAQALAYAGQLDDAARTLSEIQADPTANDWIRHRVEATLGFVALSRGDAATASVHLDRWHAALTAMHFGEPGYSRSHLDHFCALIGSGRLEDAAAFRVELDGQARRSGRASATAVVLTGSAMIAAHEGRHDDALRDVAKALAWYDSSRLRFDRARTLLIAGQIRRRAKAKGDARALLVEAVQEFESFGAAAWQALASAELARVNIRPGAPAELTETERQVAELAAVGMTNREVAERTFLAVKTVEHNLARVYRKLGIHSRAELGSRMGPDRS